MKTTNRARGKAGPSPRHSGNEVVEALRTCHELATTGEHVVYMTHTQKHAELCRALLLTFGPHCYSSRETVQYEGGGRVRFMVGSPQSVMARLQGSKPRIIRDHNNLLAYP